MIQEDLSIRSGSRRFICEATPRLEGLGHRVKIFTSKMNKKTCFEEFLHLPVEVVPVESPYISRVLKPIMDIDYYWPRWQMAMETSKRVADWRSDVVIFHYTGFEVWLPPYFYYLEKPVGAVCLHVPPWPTRRWDTWPWLPYASIETKIGRKIFALPPLSWWRAHSFEKLAMFISHSRFIQEFAMKIQSKIRPLTAIVPLGVDHSEYYPTGEEEPYALCISRFDPRKRLELALHAMKKTSSKHSLIIAGTLEERNIWYKNRLLDLADKLNISERFKFVEGATHSQIVRLTQKCSVFLFPSTVDTFGVAVLEAMACGKPIIASRAGSIPELLNGCGILIDPTHEQWQKPLRQLLSDPPLREKLGKKAFQRSRLYSWDQTVHSLMNAIEKIVARTK